MGQCDKDNGKLRPLLYCSGYLSPSQSQWHPFEQEFYGLLLMKREVIKHFGRIPQIIHTDHANITRLDYLPISRIDAKHIRWHNELIGDGSLLLYRIGGGALHALPDALSRNPFFRDELILARTGDWVLHRQAIRGIQDAIEDGRYADENPPVYTEDDVRKEWAELQKFERKPEELQPGAEPPVAGDPACVFLYWPTGEIEQMQMQAEIEKTKMELQYTYDMQLATIKIQQEKAREEFIEDRKDRRTRLQGTQQSKMISQRKNDLPP